MARTVYRLWDVNPRHPSLRLKKLAELWSVRIGSGYWALALLQDGMFFWFWIGTHDGYERLRSEE